LIGAITKLVMQPSDVRPGKVIDALMAEDWINMQFHRAFV
jgi:hypothetical protein